MEEKNCQRNRVRSDHRLKKNRHFSFIYRKGTKYCSKNFNLFVIKSKYPSYKIGYAISKKEGKANKRNLLKRRLREIVRTENLSKNYFNYIIQARVGACDLDYNEIKKQIEFLFNKSCQQ